MELIFHQFKTDWRHFRIGLLALWGLFAAQLVLAEPFLEVGMATGLQLLLLLLQVLTGAFLLARLVQADALVGTSAQWLTRPVRRPQLFWAKSGFILLGIVLPRLLPQMILCQWHHYSFDLFVDNLAEALFFTLAAVLFLVALAALTPDLPRFFLALGVVLGGFFIWTSVLAMLYRHTPARSPSLAASATVAAFLIFSLGGLLVWVWQVFKGRAVVGFWVLGLAVLALPLLLYSWHQDFLAPETKPLPALNIAALNETNQSGARLNGQILWNEFQVNGLPDHDVLVAEQVNATFNPNGKKRTYALPSFRNRTIAYGGAFGGAVEYSRTLPMDSPQQSAYLAVIRGFFPPETLWSGRQEIPWDGFPNLNELFQIWTNRPVVGGFYAHLELDEFQVAPVMRLPLRRGTWNLAPGLQLTIQEITPQQDGVQLVVEEIQAAPLLMRQGYLHGPGIGLRHDLCTFVLYQPDWGEADILDNNNQFSDSESDLLQDETCQFTRFVLPYPVLQERLAGASLQDFLNQAQLCVFLPVYQGTIKQSIQQNNFNLSRAAAPPASQTESLKDFAAIQQATLPAQPVPEQITSYLDGIFWHLPENYTKPQRQEIERRLQAIGAPGIPLLLARLPMDPRTESDFVFPLLKKLATREQLPALREALGRDLHLAEWFHDMKWDDDARDVLIGKLSDHRLEFPAIALQLAAAARDPATYPDLTWHFTRLGNHQSQVAEALAQCPGFDLDGAVREAWDRVRLGINYPGELAQLAAKQGLPDALNQAVIRLEQSRTPPGKLQPQVRELAVLTGFDGPPETALGWLSANLGRFDYDAVSHRYILQAPAGRQ